MIQPNNSGKILVAATTRALVIYLALFGFLTVQGQVIFERIGNDESGLDFANLVPENLSDIVSNQYSWNGGGVGIIDVNADGLDDIILTGNVVQTRLFLNLGDLKFKDITKSSGFEELVTGWCTGVAIADVNGDGFEDVYICRSMKEGRDSRDILLINNKNSTFRDVTDDWAILDNAFSSTASFFDYDNDGDQDLIVTVSPSNSNSFYGNYVIGSSLNSAGGSDILYKNINNKRFANVSRTAGLLNDVASGLSVVTKDFNADGWPDIFIANDHIHYDFLYENQQDGTFKEMSSEYFRHLSLTSMGCSGGDINNDGLTDLFVTDMLPFEDYKRKTQNHITHDHFNLRVQGGFQKQYGRNMLHLNSNGNGFVEIGQLANVHSTDWSYGAIIRDLNNDGWKDIFIANSVRKDYLDNDLMFFVVDSLVKSNKLSYQQALLQAVGQLPIVKKPNFFFENQGNLNFLNTSYDSGLNESVNSNGMSVADLDNDGDLELILNNLDDSAYLYKNLSTENGSNFFKIEVDSSLHELRSAQIYVDGKSQFLEVGRPTGFQSNSTDDLIFGLGVLELVDSVHLAFKNGSTYSMYNVKANRVVSALPAGLAYYDNGSSASGKKYALKNMVSLSQNAGEELDLTRFKENPLLIHNGCCSESEAFSTEIDFVAEIVRLSNQSELRQYTFKLENDSLSYQIQDLYTDHKHLNRVVPLNLNQKVRLLLVEYSETDSTSDWVLYTLKNGKLKKPRNGVGAQVDRLLHRFEQENSTISRTIPYLRAFFESDNLDLLEKTNILDLVHSLINESVQYASTMNFQLNQQISVTDFNGDEVPDLAVISPWNTLRIYDLSEPNPIQILPGSLQDSLFGWWKHIRLWDFNADGKTDIFLGNIGSNLPFRASPEEPLQLHLKDVDEDGRIDPVFTYYVQSKESTILGRDKFLKQCPDLRFEFTNYAGFANATVDDILNFKNSRDAEVYKITTTQSILLQNIGNFQFNLVEVPQELNLSSTNTTVKNDYNDDGVDDLLIVGNDNGFTNEIGELNAGNPLILHGSSEGLPGAEVITGSDFQKPVIGAIEFHSDDKHHGLVFELVDGTLKLCTLSGL